MNEYIQDNLTLIFGGAKSGKTDFAVSMGNKVEGKKIYIATADILDEEMEYKAKRHRETRGREWHTIEESIEVDRILLSLRNECSVVLLDCVTLWLSNITCNDIKEEAVLSKIDSMLIAADCIDYKLIIVSNELGMGIVPDNRMARIFRDISGKANQMIANRAKDVYFVTAGIPVKIK